MKAGPEELQGHLMLQNGRGNKMAEEIQCW